jgi:PPK2 family polyphosphate:nucleotide phosphotransferase
MNFAKRFRVNPKSTFDLSAIEPDFHGHYASEIEATTDLQHNLDRITELQRKLYADRNHSVLIVLQGIDGAGKDGTCWHVISAMDPQGVDVTGFKQPTLEELDHDFLWRVHPHAPGRGRVAIFNRSHYEDVLVVRVHKLVSKEIWKPRYELINDWEKLLAIENNTTILKFFLYISKDEQLARFEKRLDDPAHQWKISVNDYTERDLWDDYIKAFEAVLSRCSTDHAPWFVIPSDHKWFRNLAVSTIIADTLEDMKLEMPKPKVDIEEIRRLYHHAAEAGGKKNETGGKNEQQNKLGASPSDVAGTFTSFANAAKAELDG